MKIILLSNLNTVGKRGQIITVKNGYARNYLIPKKKALLATNANIKIFENKRIAEERQEAEKIKFSNDRIRAIHSIGIMVFFMKSSKENKIFGSIGIKDIIENFSFFGIVIQKHEIKLTNGLLRDLGIHTVIFSPYKNISTKFTVAILSR